MIEIWEKRTREKCDKNNIVTLRKNLKIDSFENQNRGKSIKMAQLLENIYIQIFKLNRRKRRTWLEDMRVWGEQFWIGKGGKN